MPEDPDRGFFFDLRSEDIEALTDALEVCELPGPGFPGGLLGRFGDELPEGFPFDDLPDDFLDQLPEDFPFGGGFPFGELPDDFLDQLPEDFLEELPEGFPFGRFEFEGPRPGLDRDALAECLAELGSFDSVDAVRGKLDECLPEPSAFGPGGRHHFGFDFDGFFGFESEEPELEAPASA